MTQASQPRPWIALKPLPVILGLATRRHLRAALAYEDRINWGVRLGKSKPFYTYFRSLYITCFYVDLDGAVAMREQVNFYMYQIQKSKFPRVT
jgi:hypothetical protein